MKVAAIVPAAGKGKRIKSKTHKPYIKLCGKPIIAHTLLKLSRNTHICEIIVAVNREKINTFRHEIINKYSIKNVRIVSGGKERRDSVFNALKNVSSNIDYILIHDCVRPFITNNLINSSLKAARRFGASVVGVPLKPTLKYTGKGTHILHTPDRGDFWEAQTPQVFRRDLLEKAYRLVHKCILRRSSGQASASFDVAQDRQVHKKINITDDSMLVEQLGVRPRLVLGSYRNIKVTTPEDLELAKVLITKV